MSDTAVPPSASGRVRPVRAVIGALVALVALGLVIGGAALVALHGLARDDDGYFMTSSERFETSTYAMTSDRIDLDPGGPAEWSPLDEVGTARLRLARADDAAVFVGIAPTRDVEGYLAGVARDQVIDVDYDPFDATYRRRGGEAVPEPPATQTFWVASATGPATQTLRWDIESGDWTVVVMNADASPGVVVDLAAGVKTAILLPIGLGLLVAGVVAAILAVVLLVGAFRRPAGAAAPAGVSVPAGAPVPGAPAPAGAPVPAGPAVPGAPAPAAAPGAAGARVPPRAGVPGGAGAAAYPVRLDGRLDEPLGRWLWLVKWFLAIPHFVVLAFLWVAFAVLTVVAGFAVLFTGRYPPGIFEFNTGVLAWTWRVSFYALTLGTDRYPPFTLGPAPDYPAQLVVDYPERLSQGLVLVKWWLLALPHYLIISLFGGGIVWWTWDFGREGGATGAAGIGLIGLLAIVAGVFLALGRRYPAAVFDFIMGMQRWVYRVVAYAALMRDEYPPFRLDTGGPDPGGAPAEAGAGEPAGPQPGRDPGPGFAPA